MPERLTRQPWVAGFFIAMVCSLSPSAQAAEWKICDLQVQLRDKQSNPAELQTRVKESSTPNAAECPQPGTALSFHPETEDYQTMLPRRQWPKPGQTVLVRFRYLDGECKDRGPCRIKHYSVIR
jgi:hypothetical protein